MLLVYLVSWSYCYGLAPFAAVAAGLRIKENKEVYEGEVTELTPEFTESEVSASTSTSSSCLQAHKQMQQDPTASCTAGRRSEARPETYSTIWSGQSLACMG
jgi:hypothetical protein